MEISENQGQKEVETVPSDQLSPVPQHTTPIKVTFQKNPDLISCFVNHQKIQDKLICRDKPFCEHSLSLSQSLKVISRKSQTRSSTPHLARSSFSHSSLNIDVISATSGVVSEILEKGVQAEWQNSSDSFKSGKSVQKDDEEPNQANSIWGNPTKQKFSLQKESKSIATSMATTNYERTYQASFDGQDTRTTIMIRNIPNKYSQTEAAAEIESYLPDCYDFLYLPSDSKNQCNMGYGFINLLGIQELKKFYKRFNNYRWLKFKSQKICSLTYARLQGYHQLIDHFANSKVFNQKDKKMCPIVKKRPITNLIKQQQSSS